MNDWGRAAFGDPCRECGYAWPRDLQALLRAVSQAPGDMRAALGHSDGTARCPHLAWDARAYVCHVADNLRIWAERLIAAVEVPQLTIVPYDAELLAVARKYNDVPVSGALWSLEQAVVGWRLAVEAAAGSDVTLLHPERGQLALLDVASTNAHDAHHHVFDVRRSVA